ncbi:metal ABC transporter permease [Reinekea blandensis]|uniref:High-affinity zinc uptake system membrane protein ZnuB n=1 Tax=Reinekea blandensis MED297 TaxID=314283 RepID=A4BAY3_9GAMM|nr:metal ABC transporter permease [Reinekea blandensis]EAR10596.1 high-affinity zinc uptake system membrane protein ZnuB [Reinekea sp. MED297] [Reinekea blandensis MED297]
MLDDFLIRAALAGLGVNLTAAPLGCFVIWRRMAYLGDATAHASILGVALSLIFSLPLTLSVLLTASLMALLSLALSNRGWAMDTLLGVLSHSALAIGLVAVSFVSGIRIDLMAYLFGDILAVSQTDLLTIWVGAFLVVGMLAYRWSNLLLVTLNPDLAIASGIDPKREQLILTLSLAVVVAVAIKIVGVLLIVAMLIIPAAGARPLSRTPETMAMLSAVIGGSASGLGLIASYQFDTPTGPTIVCTATLLFLLINAMRPAIDWILKSRQKDRQAQPLNTGERHG